MEESQQSICNDVKCYLKACAVSGGHSKASSELSWSCFCGSGKGLLGPQQGRKGPPISGLREGGAEGSWIKGEE